MFSDVLLLDNEEHINESSAEVSIPEGTEKRYLLG